MATIKLKDESSKTFSIDGVCYTKGDYRLQYNAKREVLIIPKAVANISNLSGLPFKNPTAWTYFVDLNDDPYNSFEEFSLAISDAINFNGAGATAQYKFLLSQSGGDDPQTATSGSLTQGATYEIVAFETGDDFTPSGAPNNTVGTKWIANGIAPTWSNGSEIGWNGGAPVLVGEVTPNTLGGGIWFEFYGDGYLDVVSNDLFTPLKTGVLIEPLATISDSGFAQIESKTLSRIKILTLNSIAGPTNGMFYETMVSIEVGN